MIDIQLIGQEKVQMQKLMWHPSELTLAKCYNFHITEDNHTITASIPHTSFDSLKNFLDYSFKNFSESPIEEARRTNFYTQIQAIHNNIDEQVKALCRQYLPYFDKFYKHQVEGVRFAFYNRAVFLAFTMRLGKSIVAASLSRIFQINRTLIVCPSVAKMGWFMDLTETWGFNPIYFTMLDASKSKTWRALQERFVICNYDTLEKHKAHILGAPIGHIIIDEAHRVKNRNSGRFAIMEEIADANPEAKITFLSGTAIANRFNDLFAYFKLTKHHLGENYTHFVDEFTVTKNGIGGNRVVGAKNIDDLRRKISNFMLVRTMDECFDMPEDIISKYTFELDDYKAEYDKIINEMKLSGNRAVLNGHLHSLNLVTSKSKIKGIIEIIEEIVEENGKVVVFASYTEPLEAVRDHFGDRCVFVDGSVSSSERYRRRTMFMEDPKIEIFFGNYLAAGEALDLSICSDVVTMNFPFTPRELQQALYRCKHPEKMKHLRIHHTFCKGSIDEHVYALLADKTRDINQLLHDGKDVLEAENMTELLIKKLLNRDEITFTDTPVSEVNGQDQGEAAPEVTAPEKTEPVSGTFCEHVNSRRANDNNESRTPEAVREVETDRFETVSSRRNEGSPIRTENGVKGPDGGILSQSIPTNFNTLAYHLVLLEAINTMIIQNDTEFTETKQGPHKLLFSHADVTEVIKELRHRRLTFTGHATEKYTPMLTFCSVDGKLSEKEFFGMVDKEMRERFPEDYVMLTDNGAIIQNTPEEIQKLSEIVNEISREPEPMKMVTVTQLLQPPPGF